MSEGENFTHKKEYALVTGGSSGIGLAFVHQLAKRGYNICIVSNQQDKLIALEKEISAKYKVHCISYFLDLTQQHVAQAIYEFCKSREIIIEVLINNAGFLVATELIKTPSDKTENMLKLHVLTPTLLSQIFAKEMAKQGKGYILNTSSTSAHMPYPLISIYGPSKAYLYNFSRALRTEMYNKNVFVSCILPGAVDTPLLKLSNSKRKLARRLGVMHTTGYIAKKGLQRLFKNKSKTVPGILNKISVPLLKTIPNIVILKAYEYWDRRNM